MEIAAGSGNGGVAKGGLNEVNGGAAVERVAGVSVAEPVRRDMEFDAGALRRLADDPKDGSGLNGAPLSRTEYRVAVRGIATESGKQAGNGGRDLDGAGFAAFAEDGDLGAVAVRLDVAPA